MSAQIGRDDVPAIAQPLRHPVPVACMVATAMDQHQRRRMMIAPIVIVQAQTLGNEDMRGRAWHHEFMRRRSDSPLPRSTPTRKMLVSSTASGLFSLRSMAAFGASLTSGAVD